MAKQKKSFEILSIGDMRKKYYKPDEQPPKLHLDGNNIPEALRPLIPLAEKWGISDDMIRLDFVKKASATEVEELRKAVAQHNKSLNDWLAGPEADSPTLSAEYLAYTNMRMAADGC